MRDDGVSKLELRMDDASRSAAAALKEQGFRIATKPHTSRIPRLSDKLTDITGEALMDQFVETTSWVDFLSVQVACAQIDERAAQNALEKLEKSALSDASGAHKSVSAAKAAASQDPRVREAQEVLDDRHAYRKLIETLANNLDRNASLISRELTRRTSTPTPTQRAGRRV